MGGPGRSGRSDPDPPDWHLSLVYDGDQEHTGLDNVTLGKAGFQNEGDNEITGIHMSNGGAHSYSG